MDVSQDVMRYAMSSRMRLLVLYSSWYTMDGVVATMGANRGIPRTMAFSAQGQMLLGQ